MIFQAAYLSDLVKYNVARDFNIRAEKLEKALEKSDDHSNDSVSLQYFSLIQPRAFFVPRLNDN